MDLDIGAVASQSGLAPATLRYYEQRGLIASVGRRGLRRQYDPSVLDQLALIALGKVAGFSLDEIGRMFAPDGEPRIDRDRLQARADAIDHQIRRLGALRDGLRHAARCPAPSHLECPSFRRLMNLATRGQRSRTAAAESDA
ncbi:helix-turn-helix domain-containing protein [Abyssibacter profundi]|uniref:MerR family transcriptional regulator n=1 Tax=Abyssibacter profundi TaxID=2182787 RepID=A0A363UMI5_9GAMM|nr:MerR family transcriptional regulator [Abyssibacter profundi]